MSLQSNSKDMDFYKIEFAPNSEEQQTAKGLKMKKLFEGLIIQAPTLMKAYESLVPRLGAKPNEVTPWCESIRQAGCAQLEGFLIYFSVAKK